MRYRPARWSLSTEVVIRTEDEERPARTGSVSRSGISVTGAARLWRGQAVVIVAPGAELAARVAWCSGQRAGLEFDLPQTKAELRAAGLGRPE